MAKPDYLIAELERNIEWFERESSKHKGLHRALRYAAFGLTAASTALASVALAYPPYQAPINLVIIVLTVSVGVVTSIEGLRKPAELWIHERTVLYSLRDLKRDLEYRSSENNALLPADEIFGRMQNVLSSARDKWSKQIAASQQTHAAQPGAQADLPERIGPAA